MGKRIIYDMMKLGYDPKRNLQDEDSDTSFNYKFVEPPIIVYWVTTISKSGNVNMTPTSLGTFMGSGPRDYGTVWYFTLSFRCSDQGRSDEDKYKGLDTAPRDAIYNLDEVPECVISYCTSGMVDQVRVSGLPIPRGISELEVAGLTPFKCLRIKPPGIAECPINMEARVIFSKVFTGWKLYVLEIDVIHVDKKLDREDKEKNGRIGIPAIDPIFELHLENDMTFELSPDKPYGREDTMKRLYFGRLDRSKPLLQEPYDIGPTRRWIGTFEIWMEDEVTKGKITEAEKKEILELKESWLTNPNQETNGKVYKELTARIKEIVWDQR